MPQHRDFIVMPSLWIQRPPPALKTLELEGDNHQIGTKIKRHLFRERGGADLEALLVLNRRGWPGQKKCPNVRQKLGTRNI